MIIFKRSRNPRGLRWRNAACVVALTILALANFLPKDALAASIVWKFPPEGTSTQQTALDGTTFPSDNWQWSHAHYLTIYAWYSSDKIDVDYINPWGGWENSQYVIRYGVICIVDGDNSSNTRCVTDVVDDSFIGTDYTFFHGRTYDYTPNGGQVYVTATFGCATCANGTSTVVLWGPH